METAFERGLKAAQARDAIGAEKHFREAHAEAPDDARIRAWLGQSLCATGNRIEGIGHLAAAGQMLSADSSPQTRGTLMEIIRQLQQWAAFAVSLPLLDGLLSRAPTDASLLLMRAATLSMLNRTDDALNDARIALTQAPGNAMTEVFVASLEADAGESAAAEQRLTRVLKSSPPPREAFRGLKEVARLFDKRGAYADAFKCLESAGQFATHVPEYAQLDRSLLPQTIGRNKAEFTGEAIRRWEGVDFGDLPSPIFVMGFFRSGTTLTQEVLAAHPGLFVADEAGFMADLGRELDRLAPGDGTVPAKLAMLDRDGIAALRNRYWQLVEKRYGPAALDRPFVDKFTMNTIDVAFINTIFPDGRVIFMVRDPRDVCVSSFQQLMVPTAATAHLLGWKATATFYAQVIDWWLHIRPSLSMPVLEVSYEEAVGNFEQIYRDVFAFAGVEWSDRALEFHRQAAGKFISTPSRGQVVQPLYTSSRERWRNYATQVEAIAPVLDPALVAFGYSKSF